VWRERHVQYGRLLPFDIVSKTGAEDPFLYNPCRRCLFSSGKTWEIFKKSCPFLFFNFFPLQLGSVDDRFPLINNENGIPPAICFSSFPNWNFFFFFSLFLFNPAGNRFSAPPARPPEMYLVDIISARHHCLFVIDGG
jgi:hypothetical protein